MRAYFGVVIASPVVPVQVADVVLVHLADFSRHIRQALIHFASEIRKALIHFRLEIGGS